MTNSMCIFLLIALGGCTSANFNSVYRTFDINSGKSVSIDAKQRLLLVRSEVYQVPSSAPGSATRTERMIRACAEPSPDVFSVLGASIAGSGGTDKVSVKLAAALSESGSNIGLRTSTIQLLRDSMYRLCEGFLSGALDHADFERLQRRYQNSMVALLAIEQLTGVTAPKQVVVKSLSTADSGSSEGPPKDSSGGGEVTPPKAEVKGESQTHVVSDTARPSDKTIENISKAVIEIVNMVVRADYTQEECVKKLLSGYVDEDNPGVAFCRAYLEELTKKVRAGTYTLLY